MHCFKSYTGYDLILKKGVCEMIKRIPEPAYLSIHKVARDRYYCVQFHIKNT